MTRTAQYITKSSFIIIISLLAVFSCSKKEPIEKKVELEKVFLQGEVQGTFYHITYLHPSGKNFHQEIKKTLQEFDDSFSIFDSLSLISRINRNEANIILNEQFIDLYKIAEDISIKTNGAFDMTVGPLVKLWGFNNAERLSVNQSMINKIMPAVGYQKLQLIGKKIVKENPDITLDANAIAQGYSCDLVAELLRKKGIENYMVEIGGEIITKGKSPRGDVWKIGINKPIDDSTNVNSEIQAVVLLEDMALATSGNYRKFYYLNGKKFGHEIDPHNGWPTHHNLLSVSVIAPTCIAADAYATAFMVMGVVKSIELLQSLPEIEAYFIYEDKNGENKTVYTRGFWKYLEGNKKQ